VIVFDADFVRMSVLPPEGHPVLLVDPNAVTSRPIAFQQLETISGWNGEGVEARRGMDPDGNMFSLVTPPNTAARQTVGASGRSTA